MRRGAIAVAVVCAAWSTSLPAPAQEPPAPPLAQAQVLTGHGATVTAAAWSPDGARVATACGDGVVRLFTVADGKLERELRGHRGVVWAVGWTPDGTRVISGGSDGTARIFTVADGVEAHVLDHGRPGAVLQVHVLSEQLVLLHGGHPTPQIWRLADGQKAGDLEGHIDVVWSVAHTGGRWVATGGQDRTARLWDLRTGRCVGVFGDAKDHPADSPNLGPGSPVLCVALSADGQLVVAGHRDGTVQGWAADGTLRFRHRLGRAIADTGASPPHAVGAALAVALTPDGAHVVAGFAGGAMRYAQATGDVAPTGLHDADADADADAGWLAGPRGLPAHRDWVQHVALSPDGTHLASGGWDRTAQVWRASDGRFLGVAQGHGARLTALAFSPDGRRLLTASGDRTARIWLLPE